MTTRRKFIKTAGISATGMALGSCDALFKSKRNQQPNILWIVAEDASPHISCYGETAITTPHLDALAAEGIRFNNAFVTSPVCSPSRSALVTGMHPVTLGTLHHRSQRNEGQGSGNEANYNSYHLPETIPLISDLFRAAGYYTCNGSGPEVKKQGKTDYNFITVNEPYDGSDWRKCPEGKPFFAQIQLRGGKYRKGKITSDDFVLPPYYPDDPVIREDWATYLDSWLKQDREIGQILQDLNSAGVLDNTIIFFLTDHGVSHMRGKQFLYDEGIRVPLIVRFPDGSHSGTVREDLVLHIDITATSLALAGINIPSSMQGQNLFADDFTPRDFIVCARDRCDETIDMIRCVRTRRYKYIRNFMSYRPHAQSNQYKDGKQIIQTMRALHAEGKLDELQDRVFNPTRCPEELYDLEKDPHETINLALDNNYQEELEDLRNKLYDWMIESCDLGLIPEPILEDLGQKYGNKSYILREESNVDLNRKLIDITESARKKDIASLQQGLEAKDPSVRYWAATWIGQLSDEEALPILEKLTNDRVPTVCVAAALALCKLAPYDSYLDKLIDEIDAANLVVGMYAMNAIEQTGILNKKVYTAANRAIKNRYDGTKRYARRLKAKYENS